MTVIVMYPSIIGTRQNYRTLTEIIEVLTKTNFHAFLEIIKVPVYYIFLSRVV